MLLKFMALLISIVPMVSAQTSILHQGDEVDSQSVIVTARTRAFLSCESGDIVVKVNFTQPFRGLMYAHRSRNSPCRVHGAGGYYYQLRIPLKGCGTWQESPRVFVNNVTIRFHPALELEEDETKTVVCRYPPPLTPAPGSIQVVDASTVGPGPVPTRVGTARLSEVEILIIICLLLFLSLLTLGIGIAYFCLKRRNIHIVRKGTVASSSAPPSQITRLSVPPPSSSLLSSVLGHTVRIPRAVPYSAPVIPRTPSSPEHHYEEYPGGGGGGSASTATTSGEEASVSSSSEDQPDASNNLLFKKVGPRSLLSIPKAILRKSGTKQRWRAGPAVHNYYSQTTSARRLPEMEDQTVITVLESEVQADDDQRFWSLRNGTEVQISKEINELQKSDAPKKPAPLYAQVDKNKKSGATRNGHEINVGKLNITKPEPPRQPRSATPRTAAPARPGVARRQRTYIADIPEESSTSEEITKNTTVTTSVRREVTETRILSPNLDRPGDSLADGSTGGGTDSRLSHTDNTTVVYPADRSVVASPKSILIRDVADIYLTTTVETESRELTTHVSRDIVEEHARVTTEQSPTTKNDVPKSPERPAEEEKSPEQSPTDHWNVVIRQRKPPPPPPPPSSLPATDSDPNSSDSETAEPKFDVKIRAIPPAELKPKEPQEMVSIPYLEMPQTVSKLKEALMPKTVESSPASKLPATEIPYPNDKSKISLESKEKTNLPQRTVRWLDDLKASAKDSTVSSSDSFQSAESLRERSSSEVLEVAPTLPSQRRNSDHPMLERSTSEITTSPDDHVRWIGGVVPVLETLSPEFLANIPVVIQGGFFNRQKTPSPENADKPKSSST